MVLQPGFAAQERVFGPGWAALQNADLFRALSFDEIGSSTVQSRAIAGLANRTAVFCMPGSTGACRTAWNGLIKDQLDERHRPCNFVKVLRGEV